MDYEKIADEIIRNVGGSENIQNLTHCFTRLRFVLNNYEQVNDKAIQSTDGVISAVNSNGQYQVVLGNKVEKVFDEIEKKLSTESNNALVEKNFNEKPLNKILRLVSEIFTPIVPAIAASGLIKGLLTAAGMIFNNFDVDITSTDTYIILFAASQIIFYYMPIFLAYTAAKALKCSPFSSMVIGGLLVYPQIDAIIQDYTTSSSIFGLPIAKGAWGTGDATRVFSYVESVIPILLAVAALAFLEKWLKKIVPEILQIILVPGLSILVMVPLTLVVLGPVGIFVGNVIQVTYSTLIGFNSTLGGALIGGLWGVLVVFGAHRALLPVGLNDVAVLGRQNLLAFAGAANFSQGGAALGVMLKTKNTNLKGISLSAMISAVLVGITEPAIYGCNLRLKKPMVCAIVSGAIGGGIMGFGGVFGDAFANNGVLTIFTYAAFGMRAFIFYLVGCLTAFFGAVVLTYIVGFEDLPLEDAEDTKGMKQAIEAETIK